MKVDWDKLRRLHEAATAGEWLVFAEGKLTDLHIAGNNSPIVHWIGFDGSDRPRTHNRANAKCIAALHNAWPSILAEREQMRAKLEAAQRLRDAVKPFVKIVTASSGRIPHERLSAANWHELCKASAAFNKDTE